jgi:hypothetical protein
MAVSPNGSELAIATYGKIVLLTLSTGKIERTWTGPDAFLGSLSWANQGSELGFAMAVGSDSNSYAYYALDVDIPGNDLTSARQVVPPKIGGKVLDGDLLSPNGNVVALLLNTNGTRAYIVEVSAGTGRPIRTLLTFPYLKSGYNDLSIIGWNADSSRLLLNMNFSSLGWLDGNHYSQIPDSSGFFRYPNWAFAW